MHIRHYLAAAALAMIPALAPLPCARAVHRTTPNATQEPVAPTASEREMFTRGQNLFLQGNYTQSAEVLVSFLQTYPRSIITDLALLWLGRSYYQVGKFVEAEEAGKRLRAIKDTPFADIYDAELRTARREAAARLSSAKALPASQPAGSSRVTSATGRSRYAGSPAANPAEPVAANKKTNAAKAGTPPATKPGRSMIAAGGVSRQPSKSTPGKSSGSSTSNTGTARAKSSPAPLKKSSVANRSPQRSANSTSPARKPAAKASSQTSQSTRPEPTPSRNRKSAASHSSGVRLPAVRKPAEVGSTTTQRGGVQRNTSARQEAASSPGESAPGQVPASQPKGLANSVNQGSNSAAPARSDRVATGGLYSLIDAVADTGSGGASLPARVDARSKRITAGPGEVVYLSFVVRNPESVKRTYELRVSAPGAPEPKMYVDSNGDGIHQGDELPVTGAPVVELKNSEVPFLLEITIPRNAFEGQQYSYTVTVLSVGTGAVVATATSTLTVSSIRAQLLPATGWTDKSVLPL